MNTFLKHYEKNSKPEIVLDIIEDCLGFDLRQESPTINWKWNSFSFFLQATSVIRSLLFWLYWDEEPDELSIIIKWWQFPKFMSIFGLLTIWLYSMTSRLFCLINVKQGDPNFKLVMKPFTIIGNVSRDVSMDEHLSDEYKNFITGRIRSIIFLNETTRRILITMLIPAYWIGPIEGKSFKHFFYRLLWSFHMCFSVVESFKHVMCVMLVIYVNCLTLFFLLNKGERERKGVEAEKCEESEESVGGKEEEREELSYENLVQGLVWLGRTTKPLKVLIGLFVVCTWTISLVGIFMVTLHNLPVLIHIAAAFMTCEMAGCLIIILITVSSIHLKIQRMIRRQFYELPSTQMDTLLRAKLNNILSLSMARNSFSCFDFFEIKQQFIIAVSAFFFH